MVLAVRGLGTRISPALGKASRSNSIRRSRHLGQVETDHCQTRSRTLAALRTKFLLQEAA